MNFDFFHAVHFTHKHTFNPMLQIKILFSDKTGTLTKNEMILQQCSVNGKVYTFTGSGIQESGKINAIKIHEFKVNDVDGARY